MQKLIGVLLGVIAVLLGIILFLLVRPSLEEGVVHNETQAEEANTAKATGPAADESGPNPIDAIVENVISNQGDAVAGPPEVKIASIPRQFWGMWTLNPDRCGKDVGDESAVDVEPRRIQFWESAGEVQSIIFSNPLSIAVTASYTGEGQSWESTTNLALSGSREKLLISAKDGKGQWYRRCPDAAPAAATAP